MHFLRFDTARDEELYENVTTLACVYVNIFRPIHTTSISVPKPQMTTTISKAKYEPSIMLLQEDLTTVS